MILLGENKVGATHRIGIERGYFAKFAHFFFAQPFLDVYDEGLFFKIKLLVSSQVYLHLITN